MTRAYKSVNLTQSQ